MWSKSVGMVVLGATVFLASETYGQCRGGNRGGGTPGSQSPTAFLPPGATWFAPISPSQLPAMQQAAMQRAYLQQRLAQQQYLLRQLYVRRLLEEQYERQAQLARRQQRRADELARRERVRAANLAQRQ